MKKAPVELYEPEGRAVQLGSAQIDIQTDYPFGPLAGHPQRVSGRPKLQQKPTLSLSKKTRTETISQRSVIS